MEYEKIKEIIKDMENSKLTSLEIDFTDGTKIKMAKENTITNIPTNINNEETHTETNNTVVEKGNIIYSPMVGTFYSKPSPNAEPYVEIGKKVKKGDVICIIEAMKLMNEIESDYDGKITEIYVKDGESVEYGQPLFSIL